MSLLLGCIKKKRWIFAPSSVPIESTCLYRHASKSMDSLRNIGWIMAKFQLYRPFQTELLSKDTKRFVHLNFFKKEIDAVNLSNFLNGREFSGVFRNQTANCILQLKHYYCTRNCQLQRVLQDIDAEEYAQNPMKCAFVIFSFGNCCCCLYLFYGFALPIHLVSTYSSSN